LHLFEFARNVNVRFELLSSNTYFAVIHRVNIN